MVSQFKPAATAIISLLATLMQIVLGYREVERKGDLGRQTLAIQQRVEEISPRSCPKRPGSPTGRCSASRKPAEARIPSLQVEARARPTRPMASFRWGTEPITFGNEGVGRPRGGLGETAQEEHVFSRCGVAWMQVREWGNMGSQVTF